MPTWLKSLAKADLQRICDGIRAVHLDGECYALAIALHRGLGWPMLGLMHENVIRHAVVSRPKSGFWDARGHISERRLGEPFGLQPPYTLRDITEDDLRQQRPVHELGISRASKMAAIVWPHLPWKEGTLQKRVLAFLDDLEAVSRKHNLWVRGPVPTCLPIIAEGDNDEGGYVMTPTDDGLGYVFDRYFTVERAFVERRT
jgi:hypothetical protein